MPSNNADGQIVFNVQIDDSTVQEQVRETTQEIERVGEAAEESGKKVKSAGSEGGKGLEMLKTGAGIAAGAVVAVGAAAVGAAAEAVKLSDDLAKAMNGFSSATGLSVEETKKYEDVLKNVYKNNYGESFEDIANTMGKVKQQMGEISETDMQSVTEAAYAFQDISEYSPEESIRSANSLMEQFGLDSKSAFNLLVQGYQNGLDYSGEMLDSINEYAPQFEKMGFSAEEMFSMLKSGAENGAFNLDKIGDAVKENAIKVIDLSATTTDAFLSLGLDSGAISAEFAAGGDVAKDAFDKVMIGLKAIQDPLEQNRIGTELFGTMWEDLGSEAVLGLSTTSDAFDGAVDSMGEAQGTLYNDLGSMLEGLKRNFELLLLPLGNALIPLIKELIQNGIVPLGDKFKDILPKLTDMAVNALPVLVDAFSNFYDIVSSIISGALPYLKDLFEQLQPSFQIFTDELLPKITQLFFSFLEPIMTLVDTFLPIIIDLFNTFAPIILDIANAIMPILIDVFNEILPIIGELINSLLPPLKTLFEAIAPLIKALSPIIAELSKAFGEVLKKAIEIVLPIINSVIDILTNVIDFVVNVFTGNWDAAWGNIVAIVKSWLNIIPNFVEDMVNLVIDGINNMIDHVNSITPTVGIDAIPRLGYIDIPTFHTGGIIDFSGKQEGLINAMDSEMVLTASQQKRLFDIANGANTTNNSSNVTVYMTNYVRDDMDINKIDENLKNLEMRNKMAGGRN